MKPNHRPLSLAFVLLNTWWGIGPALGSLARQTFPREPKMAKKSHLERVTTHARSRRVRSLKARLEDLVSPFSRLSFGSAVSPAIPDVGQPTKRRRTRTRAQR
jgi:hypothetical protein